MSKRVKKNRKLISKIHPWIWIAIIVVWPLANTFFSLDLVDTGYYLYQYDTPLSNYGVFSTYLATLIGAVWLKLFPALGMWGLNLLEVLIEWIFYWVVYQTFKSRFGKNTTLCGITIAMLFISTYVNIFNYHQLNMIFCGLLLCFMYLSLIQKKKFFIFFSGCCGALAILCRMPSILTLVCILCILYWALWVEHNWKAALKKMGGFLGGYITIGAISFLFYHAVDVLGAIINDVFRLGQLSSTDSAAYGSSSMMSNFFRDIFWGSCAAAVFVLYFAVLALLQQRSLSAGGKRGHSSVLNRILLIGFIILGIPIVYCSIYVIGQAPAFPQLTSFSWFIYGICILASFYYMIKGIVVKDRESSIDGLISMMSIALIWLCIVGSAARAKHVILGLGIIAPFMIWKLRCLYHTDACTLSIPVFKFKFNFSSVVMRRTIILTGCIFCACFLRFLAQTQNFDSPNRLSLTETVNSDRLKYIHTTKREADAVNEVLEVMEGKEDSPLMVVGNGIMFYYLTEMDSYVKPWVTGSSYPVSVFTSELYVQSQDRKRKPLIIQCKTDPYRGFEEKDYEGLLATEAANDYSGKRPVIQEFMDFYEYEEIYQNDYFIVYQPSLSKEIIKWVPTQEE